eukprot:Nk52_evm3s238 gene=Nk52_evmTU3s238
MSDYNRLQEDTGRTNDPLLLSDEGDSHSLGDEEDIMNEAIDMSGSTSQRKKKRGRKQRRPLPSFWTSFAVSMLLLGALIGVFIISIQKTAPPAEEIFNNPVKNTTDTENLVEDNSSSDADGVTKNALVGKYPPPLYNSTSYHCVNENPRRVNLSHYQDYYQSGVDVLASPNERIQRHYRAISLDNGMVALLIQDMEADVASAAMSIRVGSINDPEDLPGLAHFCEHMLFMGTEKYPEENEYQKFLADHGGASNAYTADEETNYHFQVESKFFADALDRFSRFFIDPLFNPGSTEREVSAVDSEFRKDLEHDGWKSYQMVKHSSNPNSSFRRFSVGNKHTLNVTEKDIGAALRKFYNTYYLPQNMFLVVRAREDLAELQRMVQKKFDMELNSQKAKDSDRFSETEKATKKVNNSTLPYTEDDLGKVYYFEPMKKTNQIGLFWQLPPMRDFRFVQASPLDYLSELVEQRGPNSLYDFLTRNRNWASNIMTDVDFYEDFTLFYVDIELTEEGVPHSNECIAALYKYLRVLMNTGIRNDAYWKEHLKLKELHYQFPTVVNGFAYVKKLSKRIMFSRIYPEFILRPPNIHCIDYEKLHDVMETITNPLKGNIIIRRTADSYDPEREPKNYPTFAGTFNEVEPWFRIKYSVFDMAQQQLDMWQKWDLKGQYQFKMPEPNPYIPQDLRIISSNATNDMGNSTEPVLLGGNGTITQTKAWYKFDESFLKPAVDAVFIISLNRNGAGSMWSLMLRLFTNVLWKRIQTKVYVAGQAGLGCDLDAGHSGLVVRVRGYRDKMLSFATEFLKDMKKISTTVSTEMETLFKSERTIMVESLKNDLLVDAYRQGFGGLRHVLLEHEFRITPELLKQVENIKYTDFTAFTGNLFHFAPKDKQNNNIIGTEIFVHGNVMPADVLDMKKKFETIFLKTSDVADQLGRTPHKNVVILDNVCDIDRICPDGSSNITVSYQLNNSNSDDLNHALVHYFQLPDVMFPNAAKEEREAARHKNVLMQLLAYKMKEPAFNFLRTQEKLGYIVVTTELISWKVYGLLIAVQSSFRPDVLGEKVETFLESFRQDQLVKMTEEEFEAIINSFVNIKMRKPGTLFEKTNQFLIGILEQTYEFDFLEREVSSLKAAKRHELLELFNSVTRTSLRVEVWGKDGKDFDYSQEDEHSKSRRGDTSPPSSHTPSPSTPSDTSEENNDGSKEGDQESASSSSSSTEKGETSDSEGSDTSGSSSENGKESGPTKQADIEGDELMDRCIFYNKSTYFIYRYSANVQYSETILRNVNGIVEIDGHYFITNGTRFKNSLGYYDHAS